MESAMFDVSGYDERQGNGRTDSDATFVTVSEYLRLLLCRRVLVRSDSCDRKVRGLLDVKTGRRFLIKQEQLLQRRRMAV